ncbi:related to cellulose binding protein CEL1 [Serendipita indica DSM 11827]|uniref:lytic cellulose monooxygenase (C4-dehydrogenating) n=1 Tax=Serendipita indica (strain DSM 11827) TaxID=1109443 RepID=G4TKC1_SERID|nr:related to cellulose binding protein CEL1 [Serendipita indica DSM 11827]
MKSFVSLLAFALVATTQVSAHYTFTKLIANGAVTNPFQYVRQNNNSNSPITNVMSNDMRCNSGASSGAGTSTATVAAGSTVGFALDQAIFHAGSLNVYLSKVSNAATADGSAPWFKIYQIGPVTNGGSSISWPTDNATQFTFKLPSTIQSGQYLMRIEHIALHSASSSGGAQFYISCAQLNITGGGSASPSGVSIPGVYSASDPGRHFDQYLLPSRTSSLARLPLLMEAMEMAMEIALPHSPVAHSQLAPARGKAAAAAALLLARVAARAPVTVETAPISTDSVVAKAGQDQRCCKTGTCVSSNQFYSQCLNR